MKWFGETHFWDSEWKWCAFPGFQIVAFMWFLDFEPVLALLLAIAPCIPAIWAARLVQAEFEGLWKSHHARRALAACCSMLVVIFGEEWVFRLTMILIETVQGHGDFAQRLLDPSTPYAIIFPLMLELPSALYPWKSLGSRSGEISERQSRGISFFCGFRDVGSLKLVPCISTSKSWAQPRLFGGVLSVAIDHGVLGIVPGARCSRASFRSFSQSHLEMEHWNSAKK